MKIEGKSRTFRGQDFYELYEERLMFRNVGVVHSTEKAIFVYVLEDNKYGLLKPIFEGDVFYFGDFPEFRNRSRHSF
ncbi:hypothetical protein [Capnocytophaga canis]|uniref:hypothetical protein n=1 Tax=Capnocytophaga canis TaxID=1848903 RepID=UPI0015623089|nr:hypothetical protein [Capnocytophaga canis]